MTDYDPNERNASVRAMADAAVQNLYTDMLSTVGTEIARV